MNELTKNIIIREAEVYLRRWQNLAPFAARAAQGPMREGSDGQDLGRWLEASVDLLPRTEEGNGDARGLVLDRPSAVFDCSTGGTISRMDMRYSQFAGVRFRRARFAGCLFDHSLFRSCGFEDCEFRGCTFSRSVFFSFSGAYRCQFADCSFDGIVTQGEYFHLGGQSRWERTTFRDVRFKRWEPGVYNVTFRDCAFSGCWESAIFRGTRFLRRKRWNHGLRNVFTHWADHPARFESCDFSGLELDGVVFEAGVLFQNCVAVPAATSGAPQAGP